jgi:hypothetical protein
VRRLERSVFQIGRRFGNVYRQEGPLVLSHERLLNGLPGRLYIQCPHELT